MGSGATLMMKMPGFDKMGAFSGPCWCVSCEGPFCCGCCGYNTIKVDAQAAQCRSPDDKKAVDKFIEDGAGWSVVNQTMEREIMNGMVTESFLMPKFLCCCPCMFLGVCFEPCCPGYNPCGWAK